MPADAAQIGVASLVIVVMGVVPTAREIDVDTDGVWFVAGLAVSASEAGELR